jgi:enoyl-CoA hydratase
MSEIVELSEIEAGIKLVTLNRPQRLNAITPELVEVLHSKVDELAADRTARAVILTGAGRGFCAGFDLQSDMASEVAASDSDEGRVVWQYRDQQRWGSLVSHLRSLMVPVVAAVNGPAAGGGFALALAADLRVASTDAVFVVANVKIGLSGGEMGLSYFLPRLVGSGRAAELLLTGRTLDALEAERWGIVNRVVAGSETIPAAVDLARLILANPPFAVSLTKEMITAGGGPGSSFESTLLLENRTQTLAAQSGEIGMAIEQFRATRGQRHEKSE